MFFQLYGWASPSATVEVALGLEGRASSYVANTTADPDGYMAPFPSVNGSEFANIAQHSTRSWTHREFEHVGSMATMTVRATHAMRSAPFNSGVLVSL